MNNITIPIERFKEIGARTINTANGKSVTLADAFHDCGGTAVFLSNMRRGETGILKREFLDDEGMVANAAIKKIDAAQALIGNALISYKIPDRTPEHPIAIAEAKKVLADFYALFDLSSDAGRQRAKIIVEVADALGLNPQRGRKPDGSSMAR